MAWSVGFLSELHALGIDLFLHQQGLDTTMPAGQGDVSDAWRVRRVRAFDDQGTSPCGLGEGKAGTKLGRPTIPQETEAAIRAALSQPRRPGVRKIAAQFGVDPSTVQRISRPAI